MADRHIVKKIPLDEDEKAWIRRIIIEHKAYYETLAGHSAVTEKTREKLAWFKSLYNKLTE